MNNIVLYDVTKSDWLTDDELAEIVTNFKQDRNYPLVYELYRRSVTDGKERPIGHIENLHLEDGKLYADFCIYGKQSNSETNIGKPSHTRIEITQKEFRDESGCRLISVRAGYQPEVSELRLVSFSQKKCFTMEDIQKAYNMAAFSPDGCTHKRQASCGCDEPYPCWECFSAMLYHVKEGFGKENK